ncbi:mini-chromosome maintenance complex-binding protein-like [Pyrus ussuriensis x Pyrus communis]|uniref:Mini-chromosome maintenance complex-binding protein-like n=1 Tax=Pyrus ussuriensis x Pyrus communis TaxID=2448454 RepID=A0A5N5HRU5_9ROSA|nr:mini-chromosome maintenance complex-binding protein-like [Pyrus ussuriensis x Pyrus communis]
MPEEYFGDAKFGSKKAPEPQQNGQSTDGAVSNRSSSHEENRQKIRQLLQMESYLQNVLNFIEDVFCKIQCEGSMCCCRG